jgi:molybdopterin-guanine dinucleotide biosynthesis adapter protein
MTKYIAIVGGKHSGKTTVIQKIIPILKNKGYRIVTIKEMLRVPTIDIPKEAHDTWKHSEAGADIVIAVPQKETVLFLKEKLSLNQMVSYFNEADFVILEGFEKEKVFPKIIVAKTAVEAESFSDGLAMAISGIISESDKEIMAVSKLGIPVINSNSNAGELVDLIEHKAFTMLPNLPGCSKCHPVGECGYPTCYEHAKAIVSGKSKLLCCPLDLKEKLVIEVNGIKLPLKDFPQQIVQNALIGMLSSLHGPKEIKTVKIDLKR